MIFIDSGRWKSDQPPTLYIFINCSTRDLSYIEKYVVRSVGIRKSYYLIFTSKFERNYLPVYQCVVILNSKCVICSWTCSFALLLTLP